MSACEHLEPILSDIRDKWDTEVYAMLDSDTWFICLVDVSLYVSQDFKEWLSIYRSKMQVPFSVVFCGKGGTNLKLLEQLSSEERLVV